ncbi:MAG: CinA family nicotinamide mononucleotide deamidase-related protein [Anaerolineales bacterium]|nr:CinA family nicotinamide mononucleotide deamidase-related protein [Anaerolineales bacterium]
MHAELIAIGSELTLGEIADTNSAHIARQLRTIGLEVARISAIGDDLDAIAGLVREAAARSPVVITTGGLGPTVDDPTREAVARAFGRGLEFRPELWDQITARFRKFGRPPTENNRIQAHIPAGALPVENPVGTAPAFIVEHPAGAVAALPGVPREMEHLLAHAILPYLRQRFSLTGVLKARILRTVGLGESLIDEKIGELEKLANPRVGLAAHAGQVDVRITAKAAGEAEADALIAPVEAQVRAALGEFIFAEGAVSLEEVVSQLLAERGLTLAVAEAGTDGRLNARLAVLPLAAQVYRGPAPLLDSQAPAEAAAQVRAARGADFGLAARVTRTPDKQTIEIALADGQTVDARTHGYGGPPGYLGQWAGTSLLNLLRLRLLRGPAA